jgi:chromosome partitioning protein
VWRHARLRGVAFDFAAEDDPRVLERLRTVRDYDVIVVDCPGSLEGTETLAGVLSAATFALIPMIPERAAVQPTLRTAQLRADHKARPAVSHTSLSKIVAGSQSG